MIVCASKSGPSSIQPEHLHDRGKPQDRHGQGRAPHALPSGAVASWTGLNRPVIMVDGATELIGPNHLPQLEDGACRSHQPRNRLRWVGVEAPGVTRNREEYLDRTGLMRLDRNVSCPERPGDSRGPRRGWASVGAVALGAFVIVMTEKRRTARCNT